MDHPDFLKVQNDVSEGLKYVREGRILELSALMLAQSELVNECFLTGHPVTPDMRGRTLRSILRWAIDRLRPGGEHKWFALEWRKYNTLYYFYIEGYKVAELAEKIGVADQTLYLIRAESVSSVTRVLLQEQKSPVDKIRRKNYALEDQYKLQKPEARQILRLLTAFGQSMPYQLINSVLEFDDKKVINNSLVELVNAGMVISDPTFSTILAHPETTIFLTLQLSSEEEAKWHLLIAQHFFEKRNYLESAKHYQLSGSPEKCAEILLERQEFIINDMQIDELQKLISKLRKNDLGEDTWTEIQLLMGDILKLSGNLDGAIEAYQTALSAKSIRLKAKAYYLRAMALFLTNLDEALALYNYCIKLLSEHNLDEDLLTRAYIGRAQVYLRENQLENAEDSLKFASKFVGDLDREAQSYLHSAWYYLSIKQSNLKNAVEFGQQAWLAANEIGDSVRMAEMSHNLGMVYAQLGELEKSEDYLKKSSDIAREIGNLEMVALNHKTVGGVCFLREDYGQSIDNYLMAWQMLSEMGNINWLAHTAYDLSEVYGAVGDEERFWVFFKEGINLADQAGFSSLKNELEALKDKFGFYDKTEELNARQLQVIAYLKQNSTISNREYQDLAKVSPRQALRDLKDLQIKGIIVQQGKGRAVSYRLN